LRLSRDRHLAAGSDDGRDTLMPSVPLARGGALA
jgi:hypothetical protein